MKKISLFFLLLFSVTIIGAQKLKYVYQFNGGYFMYMDDGQYYTSEPREEVTYFGIKRHLKDIKSKNQFGGKYKKYRNYIVFNQNDTLKIYDDDGRISYGFVMYEGVWLQDLTK